MSKPVAPARSWFIVRSHPTAEHRAAASLRRAGFGAYVPTRLVERQHRRSKKYVTTPHPLFPGYVLIQFPYVSSHEYWDRRSRPSWHAVTACDGVADVLGVCDAFGVTHPFPIRDRDVERLMGMQLEMAFDETRDAAKRRGETAEARYQKGMVVSITAGPFAGFEGEVDVVDAAAGITAFVSLFGRLTPVTGLAPTDVELQIAA